MYNYCINTRKHTTLLLLESSVKETGKLYRSRWYDTVGKRGTLTPNKIPSRRNTSDSRLKKQHYKLWHDIFKILSRWFIHSVDFRDQRQDTTFGGRCLYPEPTCQPVELYDSISQSNIGARNRIDMTFFILCVFPWKNSFHIWRIISLQNKELRQQTFKIKKGCSSDRGRPQSKTVQVTLTQMWEQTGLWGSMTEKSCAALRHCKADLLWGLDYVLAVSRFSVREIIKYKWNNIKLLYRLNFYKILPVWHHSPKFTGREYDGIDLSWILCGCLNVIGPMIS